MIDSHSHIYGPRYEHDRDEVIRRAMEAGNHLLLQVGCNLEESREVVTLAERFAGIYAAVGVHPHEADSVKESVLAEIEALTHHAKVLAWGETGLDFYYDNSPREIQKNAFSLQLQRAEALDLPVVIHTRDAEPETLQILRAHPVSKGGQVHCFTGTAAMADALLDLGYHIGFTGIITFKNAGDLREVVKRVPLDRMLIETDSPYLAPVPHRGKRNEPAFVEHVGRAVAEIKGLDFELIAHRTADNFRALYGSNDMEWERLSLTS